MEALRGRRILSEEERVDYEVTSWHIGCEAYGVLYGAEWHVKGRVVTHDGMVVVDGVDSLEFAMHVVVGAICEIYPGQFDRVGLLLTCMNVAPSAVIATRYLLTTEEKQERYRQFIPCRFGS